MSARAPSPKADRPSPKLRIARPRESEDSEAATMPESEVIPRVGPALPSSISLRAPALNRSGAFRLPDVASAAPEGAAPLPTNRVVSSLMWLGLGQNEARMYLGLAREGPSAAREAILASELDRATGYRVLIRLKERGLVTAEGRWPRRFRTVDMRDLWSRIVTLVREEADLHETILSTLPVATAGDESPPEAAVESPAPAARMLTASERDFQSLLGLVHGAREEILAVLPSRPFPTRQRTALARELGEAVKRGVRVRLVVDHHAADLRLLRSMPRSGESGDDLFQTRFFVPAFLHLYVVDHRSAVRFLGLSAASYRGPFVGLASESPDWVRAQELRFRSVWEGAGIMDAPAPSGPSPVLAPKAPRPTPGLRLSWMRDSSSRDSMSESTLGLGVLANGSAPTASRKLTR